MSKIYYPEDGIYKYCRNDIESCSRNLLNASNNCGFDIPSGYAYKNYLNGLNSNIKKMITEIDKIDDKLKKVNSNFEQLSVELAEKASNLATKKIVERDRMIY